eukprot:g5303.t1
MANCTASNILADPFDFDEVGTLVLYFMGMLYMFVAIHIVCDEYFVSSIHAIVERYSCDEDVAGATLMAAASSAPELFAGAIGVFVDGSEEVGVGTVVGSCVFNMCVIIGGCALVYPHSDEAPLKLGGFSLVRDGFFYILSVILLYVIFEDGIATPAESVILFVLYLMYIGVTYKFKWIKDRCREYMENQDWCCDSEVFDPVEQKKGVDKEGGVEIELGDATAASRNGKPHVSLASKDEQIRTAASTRSPTRSPATSPRSANKNKIPWDVVVTDYFFPPDAVGGERSGCCPKPNSDHHGGVDSSILQNILWYVQIPIRWAFHWTIPDCRLKTRKDWYFVTFAISILWLGLLVFLMLEWAKKAGCLAGISGATMGLTFCAAGTSAPDCFISLIVARGGRGKMAICNVFGSNIFDILLCLGFPLTLSAIVHGGSTTVGKDGIVESVIILFALLGIFYASVFPNKLIVSKHLGPVLLLVYAAYIIFVFVDNEA